MTGRLTAGITGAILRSLEEQLQPSIIAPLIEESGLFSGQPSTLCSPCTILLQGPPLRVYAERRMINVQREGGGNGMREWEGNEERWGGGGRNGIRNGEEMRKGKGEGERNRRRNGEESDGRREREEGMK